MIKLTKRKSSSHCANANCASCSISNPYICTKCNNNTFLYNNTCLYTCPLNTFNDVISYSCIPKNNQNINNHFFNIKSYSIGSCRNLCGQIAIDCSCEPNCVYEGNCCSDYSNYCEILYIHNNIYNCNIEHCLFCESNDHCGQCQSGYWLREGNCTAKCSINDYINNHNHICEHTNSCSITNCEQCNNNNTICIHCRKGFFLYNNQCLVKCPSNYIANKREWNCVSSYNITFSLPWYTIFPSKHSCQNSCGLYSSYMDCSCHQTCFQQGTCCHDIDEYCSSYIPWK